MMLMQDKQACIEENPQRIGGADGISGAKEHALHMEPAGIMRRTAAFVIDALVIGAICAALAAAIAAARGRDIRRVFENPQTDGLLILAVGLLYHILTQQCGKRHSSPGKRLLKIEIVRAGGDPLSWIDIWFRSIVGALFLFLAVLFLPESFVMIRTFALSGAFMTAWLLTFLLLLLCRDHRGIPDRAAGTVVIVSPKRYSFYGWQNAAYVRAKNDLYPGIATPIDLYDALSKIWCADTCAPRMRADWSRKNKTLGQCSITAFLAQDIFGGEVYAMPTDNGGVHCYNVVDGYTFDLTSEQFGERAGQLCYEGNPLQDRFSPQHFGKEEKRLRYEYLCEKLYNDFHGRV